MLKAAIAAALFALLVNSAASLEFDLISQRSVLKQRREAVRRSTDLVLTESSTVPAFTAQVTIGQGYAATNFELALSSQASSIVVLGAPYAQLHPVTYSNGTAHVQQGASVVAKGQTGSLYDFGVVNYDVYADQVVFDTFSLSALPVAVVTSVGTTADVTNPFASGYDGVLGLGLKSQALAATGAVAASIEAAASTDLVPATPAGIENANGGGLTISALFCDTWGKLYLGSVSNASTDAQASNIIYGQMSTSGYNVVLRSASIGSSNGLPNIFLATGNVVFDFTAGSLVVPADAWTAFVSNVQSTAAAAGATTAGTNCWQSAAFTSDVAVNAALPTLKVVAGDILFDVAATNSYVDVNAATNTICISAVQGTLAGQLIIGGIALESLFITFDRSTALFPTGAVGLAVSAACTSPASASYSVQSYSAYVQASLNDLSNSVATLPDNASVAQIQAAVGTTLQSLNSVSTLGDLDAAALASVQLARFQLITAVIRAFQQGSRKRANPTAADFQNALSLMDNVAFVPSQLNATTIESITNFLVDNAHWFGDLANGASSSDVTTLEQGLQTYVQLVDIILLTHVTPVPNSAANFNPIAVGASESFDMPAADAATLFNALESAAGGLVPFITCSSSLTAPAVTVGVTITLYASGASGFSVSSASTSGTASSEPSGSISAPTTNDASCFGVLYIQTLFDQFAGQSVSVTSPDAVGWILYTQFYGGSSAPIAPEAENSLTMSVSVPLVNGLSAAYSTMSCIQRNTGDSSWSSVCTKDTTLSTATQFVCTCSTVAASGTYFSVGHAPVQPFYGNGSPMSLVGSNNVIVDVATSRDCVAYDATLGAIAGWEATINDGTVNAKPACCTRRGMFDSSSNECNIPRCTAPVSAFSGFVSGLTTSDVDFHVTGTFCYVQCYAPGTSVPAGGALVQYTSHATSSPGSVPEAITSASTLKNAYVVSVYNTIEAAYTITVGTKKRIGSTSYACISKGTLTASADTCSIPGCNTVRDVSAASAFVMYDGSGSPAANDVCYTDCYSL